MLRTSITHFAHKTQKNQAVIELETSFPLASFHGAGYEGNQLLSDSIGGLRCQREPVLATVNLVKSLVLSAWLKLGRSCALEGTLLPVFAVLVSLLIFMFTTID